MKAKRTFDQTLFDEVDVDLNLRVEDTDRFPDPAGNTQGVLWEDDEDS